MKKICVISPDAIRIPLIATHSDTVCIKNEWYTIEEKCTKAAATGIRAQKIAEFLSSYFEVTLLIPDLNYPGSFNIDFSQISYKIESYDYYACQWKFSKKLNKQLKEFDCIILQSTAGIGFKNIAKLKKSKYVVLDGYIPLLAEFPAAVSHYPDNKAKIANWNTLLKQYSKILSRTNLLLSATDRQQYYYEGQLLLLDKLNIKNFKNSNILKVPYGVDRKKEISRSSHEKIKLLWYGPFYPWYDFELLINELRNHENICIDFYGINHPRYRNFVGKFVDLSKIVISKNMRIVGEFDSRETRKLLSEYTACILITKNWLEDTYSHRARIFEMLSYNIPVITNSDCSLIEESSYLNGTLLHKINSSNLKEELEEFSNFSRLLNIDTDIEHKKFLEQYNWNTILQPLKDKLLREI